MSSSPKPAEPCPQTCRIPGGKGSGTCDSGQAPRTGQTLLVSAPVASTSSPQHRLQLVQTSPWYFQPPLSDWKCLEFHSRRQQPWRIWGRERIPIPPFPPPVHAHVSALTLHPPCPNLQAEGSHGAAFPQGRERERHADGCSVPPLPLTQSLQGLSLQSPSHYLVIILETLFQDRP